MTPERWQQVKELLHTTLELEPERRAQYLSQMCADEPDLKWEIESLLASYEEAGDFIAKPALAYAAVLRNEPPPDPLTPISHFDCPSLPCFATRCHCLRSRNPCGCARHARAAQRNELHGAC